MRSGLDYPESAPRKEEEKEKGKEKQLKQRRWKTNWGRL